MTDDFMLDISDETFPMPELAREMNGPRHLSTSQAAALKQLCDLFALHGEVEHGGICVRTHALLVGPSGSGKTSLVRRLMDTENLSGQFLAAGTWIVTGARRGQSSLDTLRAFVASIPEGEKGLICIDELDKILAHGDQMFQEPWSLAVYSEVVSLLDSDGKLRGCGWTDQDIQRLKNSIWIVGCGTWEHLTKVEPSRIDRIDGDHSYTVLIKGQPGIPTEILFRFGRPIEVHPPTRRDFAVSIRRIRSELGLPRLAASEETKLVNEVEESGLGMRALEGMLVDLLIAHPRLQTKAKPEEKRDTDDQAALSMAERDQKLLELMNLVSWLRIPASEIHAKLAIRLAALKLSNVPDPLLSAEELKSIVQHMRIFREALEFEVCLTKKLKSRREQELLLSGKAISKTLSQWLADKPFGLQEVGLLEGVVKVQAWTARLVGLVELLTTVPVIVQA